jgi:hypothetical protein
MFSAHVTSLDSRFLLTNSMSLFTRKKIFLDINSDLRLSLRNWYDRYGSMDRCANASTININRPHIATNQSNIELCDFALFRTRTLWQSIDTQGFSYVFSYVLFSVARSNKSWIAIRFLPFALVTVPVCTRVVTLTVGTLVFERNKCPCPPCSKTKALGSSQGTSSSSPATMSAFSRVVGAATTMTNKQPSNQTQAQIQGTSNPLGIAAVLLQGAQGKFKI